MIGNSLTISTNVIKKAIAIADWLIGKWMLLNNFNGPIPRLNAVSSYELGVFQTWL